MVYIAHKSWYIVIKTVKGRRYRYRQRTRRDGDHVRTENKYIGPVGATFYRGGGRGVMPSGMTAENVLNYETDDLGTSLNVEEGVELSAIPSERLRRVTKSKKAARQYGEVTRVQMADHQVIARDQFGGLLVESNMKGYPDDSEEYRKSLRNQRQVGEDRSCATHLERAPWPKFYLRSGEAIAGTALTERGQV